MAKLSIFKASYADGAILYNYIRNSDISTLKLVFAYFSIVNKPSYEH